MAVAAKVKHYLDGNHVSYRILRHSRKTSLTSAAEQLTLSNAQLLKTDILVDNHGYLMVVYPFDRRVDFNQLKKVLNRNLTVMPWYQMNQIFTDCEPGAYPPFGTPYGLKVLLDSHIENMQQVYFEPGSHTCMLSLNIDDFLYLMNDAVTLPFTGEKYAPLKTTGEQSEIYNMKDERIKRSCPLPSCPVFSELLLTQSAQKKEAIKPMLEFIESKSELVNWIIDFENVLQKLSNQNNEHHYLVETMNESFSLNMIKFLAIFFNIIELFKASVVNENSLLEFSEHAIMTTLLTHAVYKEYNHSSSEDIFTMSLFHNIGFLLFAYLFPPEFNLLKQWVKSYPHISVEQLEKRLIGLGKAHQMINIGHAKLGAWLLEYWHFPDSIVTCAKVHHSAEYLGGISEEVKMIQLANGFLRERRIGDGTIDTTNIMPILAPQFDARRVIEIFESIYLVYPEVTTLAQKLCLVNR